ncbi:hypothetical protein FQN50_003565 [Emmonsiellopsis sp. PD_5]|nr:hypothetical protein FQN50_003565 [Emmonsiellopsis sp. PD_5]
MSPPLPAILCLHGSGTSSEIFQIQTIRLRRELSDRFSFVFVNAPFETEPGPGVLPVFADVGPYYTWVDPRPSSPPPSSLERRDDEADKNGKGGDGNGAEQSAQRVARLSKQRGRSQLMPPRTVEVIEEAVRRQVEKDGRGFVGVLGFSMGARLAAGLVLEQQQQQQAVKKQGVSVQNGDGDNDVDVPNGERQETTFKFSVSICGTFPPITRLHDLIDHEDPARDKITLSQIEIPALHILGLKDPWFTQGELMATTHFSPATRSVRRLDMGHHLPVQKEDNMVLVNGILDMARKTGVL